MPAWIQFNEQLSPWSAFTFWMVVISVILTLGFTAVVFFGGLGDLRFLLRSLDEERVDETDDGRAVRPVDTKEPSSTVNRSERG